jgi:hypothetical protein
VTRRVPQHTIPLPLKGLHESRHRIFRPAKALRSG